MNTKLTARRAGVAVAMLAVAAAALTGCSAGSGSGSAAGDGTGDIVVWGHQGQDSEVNAIQDTVKSFNASQKKVHVTLKLISGDTYTSTVTNTPTNKLPDVLEMDGPTLASYAYNGKLAPLTGSVSKSTVSNATDGSIAEGTYDGKLYGLAQYSSAMGLYGNKKMLEAAGVSIPSSPSEAWTPDQFSDALKKLAAANASGKSLDLSESALNGEWGTYGFSPMLQSAGGNLVKGDKASGVLDSSDSVKALEDIASWKPYVDSNTDGNAFPNGRVALSLSGHWNYPTYSKAVGSDLVALPLPNFGDGEKVGAGSWTWGIGSATKHGKAAGAFLDYLLNDANVKAITDANGAPAATKSAFTAQSVYQSGGALALWGKQLEASCPATAITKDCIAVYRPVTPGYPVITSKFSSALSAVWGGADAKEQLTTAAKSIDQAYSDNNDYK